MKGDAWLAFFQWCLNTLEVLTTVRACKHPYHFWHCLQKIHPFLIIPKKLFPDGSCTSAFHIILFDVPIQGMLLLMMRNAMNSCCFLPRQPWPLPVHIGQQHRHERTLITRTSFISIFSTVTTSFSQLNQSNEPLT